MAQTEETDINAYAYEVSEDTDTRTGEKNISCEGCGKIEP